MKTLQFVLLFCASVAQAAACSCDFPPVEKAVSRSTVVFIGTVVKLEASGNEIIGAFRDLEVLKGDASLTEFTVSSPRGISSCGLGLEIDRRYLVYASVREAGLWTSRCERTKPMWNPSMKEEGEVEPYGELESDMVRTVLGLPPRPPAPKGVQMITIEKREDEEAQPGATDNPDDAQRLREDH